MRHSCKSQTADPPLILRSIKGKFVTTITTRLSKHVTHPDHVTLQNIVSISVDFKWPSNGNTERYPLVTAPHPWHMSTSLNILTNMMDKYS